jgi:drug/metabolite transporter (DMT)-like permease
MGATLAMLEPMFCYLAGVALFGELLSARSVIGTLLIIGSCVAVLLHNARPAGRAFGAVEKTEFV